MVHFCLQGQEKSPKEGIFIVLNEEKWCIWWMLRLGPETVIRKGKRPLYFTKLLFMFFKGEKGLETQVHILGSAEI